MTKKRKRKFLLSYVLALSIGSHRMNVDLFVKKLSLPPVFTFKLVKPIIIPKYVKSHGIVSRLVASASSDIPNNNNPQSKSYFDSVLNTIFENKQLQKKFKHASQFWVLGNYNSTTFRLFREELIKHIKAN